MRESLRVSGTYNIKELAGEDREVAREVSLLLAISFCGQNFSFFLTSLTDISREPWISSMKGARRDERRIEKGREQDKVTTKTVKQTQAAPLVGTTLVAPTCGSPANTYSAILSRNEAVKDAKRLKNFLELKDKYVRKKVVFEDPLFPADNSSLFYSCPPPIKVEWKRPSVSTKERKKERGTHPEIKMT